LQWSFKMMIKRCLSFIGLALALCCASFGAYASELVGFGESIYRAVAYVQPYGGEHVKHELTLAEWRTESQPGNTAVASNLIALSNHFGMARAAPFGVPDWDSGSAA
jgi:hypothetical protein